MRVVNVLSALILLLVAATSSAAERIVTVATLEDYSPYCFPIENSARKASETIPPGEDSSRLQGYSWDILRSSLHDQGYTIELIIAPWARAFSLVETGKVDVLFPTGLSKERAEFFYYSREPINRANFLVYVNPDSDIQWDNLDSLNGRVVGVMRGWNFGADWDSNTSIEKYEVSTIAQGFKMLDAGRLDGLAGYEVNFDHALKNSDSKRTYKKLPAFDFSSEYLAGAKNNANVIAILDDFDVGKRNIMKSGIFDQIVQKWQE